MRVVDRYLLTQFLALFVPVVGGLVVLYLIIDFLDRLDILLENDATLSASVRYFLFKIPLIITQILPAAMMVSALLSVGLLARHKEVIALRASGISLFQTTRPLLILALGISVLSLIWNETAVPYFTHAFQQINRIEIRKRGERSVWSERGIWYRGGGGFYNIEFFDSRASTLYGLTIYRLGSAFDVQEIVEIPAATWTGARWRFTDGWIVQAGKDAQPTRTRIEAAQLYLPETIADFKEVHLEAEELSYTALRNRVMRLAARGIDTSHYAVELNLKLAVPFAVLGFMWVGVPIAGRVRRSSNLATTFALGLVVGFGYWVLLGFTRSLGETQVLWPWLSAWTPNLVIGLAGAALHMNAE